MSRTEKTACILCSRNCGLEVTIEDQKMVRIKGDPDHPMTHGYICQKAARLQHYQAHSDRVTQPLKRNDRGEFEAVSWEAAITDIAEKLNALRKTHGGKAFATAGGGGQGNHLGGAYLAQIRQVMGSYNAYNSLAQEKTGDFWLNGRLFGRQTCHTTEDVEHSDFVIFLGCNPFQAHGIPNARDTLKAISKDPGRTMVVIDPRRTETVRYADIHLALRPGTDAFLMSALLAIIVRDGLHDRDFLEAHCTGFDTVEAQLRQVPVDEYIAITGLDPEQVKAVAHGYAKAKAGCLRVDLGIQHTLNSTLNSYLEKLLFLVAGHFGKPGTNNLHSYLIPILGNTDERNPRIQRTAYHNMFPVSGFLPPAILPDEILKAGEDRIRAVFVDSCNPLLTWPDTQAYEKAFSSLELLVVVDVAMTETARLADYVLPAASQFEKWEFTGFNLEFPRNGFHLRHPLFPPQGNSLPEPEIYTRILEAMGALPANERILKTVARFEPGFTRHLAYLATLTGRLMLDKKLMRLAPSLLYRTLGSHLPEGSAAAALLLPLCLDYARKYPEAVKRAGHTGNRLTLGTQLFNAILEGRSGIVFSEHTFDEVWKLIRHPDRKIHLEIPEMMDVWQNLVRPEPNSEYPFILAAGERRSYNANQIYRDPEWRKTDAAGSLRIHPDDAGRLGISQGDPVICRTPKTSITVTASLDDSVLTQTVSLPHGYGARFNHNEADGPALNLLTDLTHRDPVMMTPLHKYVPVALEKVPDTGVTASG